MKSKEKTRAFHVFVSEDTYRKFRIKVSAKGVTAKSVFMDFVEAYTRNIELPEKRLSTGGGAAGVGVGIPAGGSGSAGGGLPAAGGAAPAEGGAK